MNIKEHDYEEWSRVMKEKLESIYTVAFQAFLLIQQLDPLMSEYKDSPKDTQEWKLNGVVYRLPVGTTEEIDTGLININYLLSNLLK